MDNRDELLIQLKMIQILKSGKIQQGLAMLVDRTESRWHSIYLHEVNCLGSCIMFLLTKSQST